MRLDLSNYSSSIHCAIAGHCFTIKEQRKLLKKARYDEKNISDADCHEIITAELKEKTHFKNRIQKYLDAKYKNELNIWDNILDVEYLKELKKISKNPNIGGHIYALLRQPDIPKKDLYNITGIIHILAYNKMQEYASPFVQNKLLVIDEQESKIQCINREKLKLSSELRKQNKLFQKQNIITESLKKENEELKSELLQVKKIKEERGRHKDKIARLVSRVNDLENTIIEYEQKEKFLKLKLDHQSKELLSLKSLLKDNFEENINEAAECENCINKDLCAKRVLIVGGMSKLTSYYKSIIEEQFGGVFDHNDGYLKNGDTALKHSIQKADYVLCPVDVNSHNACHSVKLHCKKMNKPYFMLKNSGVSYISKKITEIVNISN